MGARVSGGVAALVWFAWLGGVAPLSAQAGPAAAPAWQNPSLSAAARAADLVGRMTLDEKVSQMVDQAAAIPRLGIPAYPWWNEALHGVARAGLATSFPQAIGMAATWDDSLIFRAATVISDEARAKYHEILRQGGTPQRFQALTFWSPNVNLFRDPRWGRGQETYGEDPFLSGRLAVQFVRGLQGDDPQYLKTVSTPKHFAVHSGPEPARHTFDVEPTERDLDESYLPQFRAAIVEGGAQSVMCAYNRVDSFPACASDLLLKQILRGRWGFRGYVVSDCDAVGDIYRTHKVAASAAAASARAVEAGTDLDCGRTYDSLVAAVHQGLVSEALIDTSVTRLFTARFRLGMFDPPAQVKWAQIPFGDLDSPAHRTLALDVAEESMVLLKNASGVLPLKKDVGTIAVIGPDADQAWVLLGNYNGTPADPITPLRGIREAVSRGTRVIYAQGSDFADSVPVMSVVPSAVLTAAGGQHGLDVTFYAHRTMDGAPLFTRVDSTLDADWQEGAPRADMDPDDFGVRWTATLRAPVTGTYRLGLIGTVKYFLYLDDSLVLKSFFPQRNDEPSRPFFPTMATVRLEAGRDYHLRVEGQESYGVAGLQMLWAPPSEMLETQAVQAAEQADVVVLCLGITSRLEGEEMRIHTNGFVGGDRTSLDLPAPQERLLERIAQTGKPTALVLLNGSALSVNWAQDHVPAILEAWYPGQAGGTAIANVLFGDYNPGGRLPVTFYKSTSDLPPFDDYRMAGRTYRYFEGTPLYPFGYGLSYTTFAYDRLQTSSGTLRGNDTITVSVDVRNTGSRAGDEVVQLYVRHLGSKVARPKRELRGFQRVTLQPGERRTVRFRLLPRALAYWDTTSHGWKVEDDRVALEMGASSTDVRATKTIRVAGQR
ncbi:MAG: glycoside hydrolase family 3 C-terminal domain-containing protein [Gemmatimonadales bacterium]